MLQDETARLPAVKVHLLEEDYLKKEQFNLLQMDNPHPVNVAFATFAAVKRLVGMSRGKIYHLWTLGPASPEIRKFTGFTKACGNETVRFSANFGDGSAGCPRSWDTVLGERWDILPAQGADEDTGIRLLRFTEHRDFGFFIIRCYITTCRGHYRSEDDYRQIIVYNYQETRKGDQCQG